jgi:nicotinamide-nucleotide amidase
MTAELPPLLHRLAEALRTRGAMMATAESCTGGLIAGACTSLSGSSDWFDRAWVTYSNRAKTGMLGVAPVLIERHGAVSAEVAAAMAEGARTRAGVAYALAVTGIAGPTGGSADKPVGTVWFAWVTPTGTDTECRRFDGDRTAVREQTVRHALQGLLQRL